MQPRTVFDLEFEIFNRRLAFRYYIDGHCEQISDAFGLEPFESRFRNHKAPVSELEIRVTVGKQAFNCKCALPEQRTRQDRHFVRQARNYLASQFLPFLWRCYRSIIQFFVETPRKAFHIRCRIAKTGIPRISRLIPTNGTGNRRHHTLAVWRPVSRCGTIIGNPPFYIGNNAKELHERLIAKAALPQRRAGAHLLRLRAGEPTPCPVDQMPRGATSLRVHPADRTVYSAID